MKHKQDHKGMAQVMVTAFNDIGDDFLIMRDTEKTGAGQVIVKSKEAMEALTMGIEKLRQRKATTGKYLA